MLKKSIHPKIVQERPGHASIAITLDTYSHVSPGLQAAAAKSFDEAFINNYNKRSDEAVEKFGRLLIWKVQFSFNKRLGGVTEWTMVTVLKTVLASR